MQYLRQICSEVGEPLYNAFKANLNHTYVIYDTKTKTERQVTFFDLSDEIIGVTPYKGSYVLSLHNDDTAKFESLLKYRGYKYTTEVTRKEAIPHVDSESGIVLYNKSHCEDERTTKAFNIGEVLLCLYSDAFSEFMDYIYVDNIANTVSVNIGHREFVYDIVDVRKFNIFITKLKMLNG